MTTVNTVTVWHAKKPRFSDEGVEWNTDNYELVAIIEPHEDGTPRTLDEAFELTNHIDHAWWDNKGVIRACARECRSTSVGDVVVRDGTSWLCASVGWKSLAKGAA